MSVYECLRVTNSKIMMNSIEDIVDLFSKVQRFSDAGKSSVPNFSTIFINNVEKCLTDLGDAKFVGIVTKKEILFALCTIEEYLDSCYEQINNMETVCNFPNGFESPMTQLFVTIVYLRDDAKNPKRFERGHYCVIFLWKLVKLINNLVKIENILKRRELL